MTIAPRMLWLGPTGADFAAAHAALRARGTVSVEPSAPLALGRIQWGDAPDLIVVAQRWPGEWTTVQFARLQQAAPLARIWQILGSWCEGEARSGKPPLGVVRSYWHQWPARAAREFPTDAAAACAAWSMPSTMTEEERLLADAAADDVLTASGKPGRIAVVTDSETRSSGLASVCRAAGHQAEAFTTRTAPKDYAAFNAVLWDLAEPLEPGAAILPRLAAAARERPLLALLNFPRRDDAELLRHIGARSFASKPIRLADLVWQVDQLVSQQ